MGRTCDQPPRGSCWPERPRRRPPPPGGCRPDCGYIVEKIISSDTEDVCFSGLLQISGLPDGLCSPLCLRGVDVMRVEPVCESLDLCGVRRLRVLLCCYVSDSRGCRAEGTACIEVEVCGRNGPRACGVNVRRGAQVFIQNACFCPPCAFDVCLRLCITTIVSRCEAVGSRPACPTPCPDLPLYPPPIHVAPGGGCCARPCAW